jgi:hypothetical protein
MRILFDLIMIANCHKAALVEHGNAIGDGEGRIEVMSNHD